MSFNYLLALLFIGLKLTHFINWSWFWVLFPAALPLLLVVGALGIATIQAFLPRLKK